MTATIYVLNGPNLNLLGTREPGIYGSATLNDVEAICRASTGAHGMELEFRQSNHEGDIVNAIQEAIVKKAAGIVINPAGYTTTSVAILDALLAADLPVVEVHISNIYARETFRQQSLVSKAARAVLSGFGIGGYALAIAGLAAMIEQAKQNQN